MPQPNAPAFLLNLAGRFIVSLILIAQFIPILDSGPSMFDDANIMRSLTREHEAIKDLPFSNTVAYMLNHQYERRDGRFMLLVRPLFYMQFLMFGDDFYIRHIFECAVWIVALQLIYSLALRISRSPMAGFLAGILFVLAAPCGTMLPRVHMSEQFITSFQFGAWLLLWCAERIMRTGFVPALSRGLLFAAAIPLIILSLMLKETAMPIISAIVIYSVLGMWKGNPLLRRHYRNVFAVTMIIGVFFSWLIIDTIGNGRYLDHYGHGRSTQVVTNALLWRETFVIGFGPLLYLGCIMTAFRGFSEWSRGYLSVKTRWKIALYSQILAFIVIHAPWPSVLARYSFPAVALISVVLAIEASDIWRWSRCKRTASGVPGPRWEVAFGASILAMWFVSPLDPIMSLPVAIVKIGLCSATIYCGYRFYNQKRDAPFAHRVTASEAQLGRVAVSACLVFFVVTSPIARISEINRGTKFTLGEQEELWDYLIEHVPEDGRVVVIGGRDCVGWDFSWYLANYRDRPDIDFKYRFVMRGHIVPEGAIAEYKGIEYMGITEVWETEEDIIGEYGEPYDTAGRDAAETFNRFREVNGYMLHPGRYLFAKLGIDEMGYLPPSRRWAQLSRIVDYGWRIYSPLPEDQWEANRIDKSKT